MYFIIFMKCSVCKLLLLLINDSGDENIVGISLILLHTLGLHPRLLQIRYDAKPLWIGLFMYACSNKYIVLATLLKLIKKFTLDAISWSWLYKYNIFSNL